MRIKCTDKKYEKQRRRYISSLRGCITLLLLFVALNVNRAWAGLGREGGSTPEFEGNCMFIDESGNDVGVPIRGRHDLRVAVVDAGLPDEINLLEVEIIIWQGECPACKFMRARGTFNLPKVGADRWEMLLADALPFTVWGSPDSGEPWPADTGDEINCTYEGPPPDPSASPPDWILYINRFSVSNEITINTASDSGAEDLPVSLRYATVKNRAEDEDSLIFETGLPVVVESEVMPFEIKD